jgi:3-hydroxybutyryl-CoA dehydrogenase
MEQFKNAAVVGAGTMGHGIAYILAEAGIDVCLIDHNSQALDQGLAKIEQLLEDNVLKQKILIEDAHEIRSRVTMSTDLEAMANCDVMIEAVSEDIELKHHIFALADALTDDHALLATNTSSLSLSDIASVVVQKERFLGLHFFNPPHIMKLLEIVVHEDVSFEAVESAKELALLLRKECIVVNDSPGFATSRLGIALALEAIRMLETGVAGVIELDTAMKLGYGHPMGPLMLSDWVGLDIRLAISEHLYRKLDSAVFLPPDLLRRMVRAGFLGKKSGTGFYEWDKGRHLGVSQSLVDLSLGA